MSDTRSVVVLGGGLSGMAAAYALARVGFGEITVIEREAALGGLAGTFERNGHFYPLAYHHINAIDQPLLYFLHAIGSLDKVQWKRIRMLFRVNNRLYDLAHPADFIRFPMSPLDKLRFVRLMLRAFRKKNWDDWNHRSAAELVDTWASPGVRSAIFEPLCRLKFDLPSHDVSAAWLGARLHHREGSSPLGYIPGCNWTQVLCSGLTHLLRDVGVNIRTGTSVARMCGVNDEIREVQLDSGERLRCDFVISSVPTVVYRSLVPTDATPALASIRYTAVISVMCVVRLPIDPDFYWLNLASERCNASGIFVLNSLNSTIGAPGESCINFVTHLHSRNDPAFRKSDEELLTGYIRDFRSIFGITIEPEWTHVARIPTYSPILVRNYANPPLRSVTWRNVYFAGNYLTFPSLVSTGTALLSGVDAAETLLHAHGTSSDLAAPIRSFHTTRRPSVNVFEAVAKRLGTMRQLVRTSSS